MLTLSVPGGGALGGHLTFQILTLLRYVVDIGKKSPNPKFFWNPMKTDEGEAYIPGGGPKTRKKSNC